MGRRMDSEDISQTEMLDRIAELEHGLSQERDRNIQMIHLVDAADDEIRMLRLGNSTLKKQLEALKKVNSEVLQVEVEPCMCSAADVNSCTERRVHDLEKEVGELKEQNKQLTEQVKQITEERDQKKMSLSRMGAACQSLEREMEEVQLELQRKEELIDQKDLQLKHLHETVEEYSDIIKDLRLTKQQLSEQLEDRREEASMASAIELIRAEPTLQLSIAEEILLASPHQVAPQEPEVQELQEEEVPAAKTNGEKFAHTVWNAAWKTAWVLLLIFCLFVFAIILLVCYLLYTEALSFKPYITVSHTGMPPI